MQLYGLQKMTLLDFPGKVACTVFTGGCNLRCPFCHNSALVTDIHQEESMPDTDILAFLDKRQGLLDGVAVTGGEPLLSSAIFPFLRSIREKGYAIKLDTNGCFPDRLRQVVEEGLADFVAVDIKNAPAKYAETVGIEGFDLAPVRESVAFLLSGVIPFEFRTTVVQEFHTPDDIAAIGAWIQGAPRYFLQNFTDSGALITPGLHPVDQDTRDAMLKEARRFVPTAEWRGV